MRGARIFGGFVVLGLGISAVDERPSRIIRAIYVSSQVAIDYKINGKSSQVHTRTGQRILELCLALGGPFIKAGQFLAAMNHTVPKEITDILAKLQDNTSPKSLEYVERVIREDLGDHVFEKIEEAPVGSASLAQVHKAWIKGTGDVVAVKVQYPNLREIVEADLSTMAMISFVAAKTFLKADFTWIFQEFKESLLSELDFVQEAKRAQRVAVNLKEDSCFYVPKVYPQYTSKRVLTMEFVQGCKVSEVEKIESMGMDPKRVARKVIEMFSRMIYINGFFHCDP
jgi:aarF domain-containing kinase